MTTVSDSRKLQNALTARAALNGSRFTEHAAPYPTVLVFDDALGVTIYVDLINSAVEVIAPGRMPRFISLGSGLLDAVERMLEQ